MALTGINLEYSASNLAKLLKETSELKGDFSPGKIKEIRNSKGFFSKLYQKLGDRSKRKNITKKAECNNEKCKKLAKIIIDNGYYQIFTSEHAPRGEQELLAVSIFIGQPDDDPDRLSTHKLFMRYYQETVSFGDKPENKDKGWTFIEAYNAYKESIRVKREAARLNHINKTEEELIGMITDKNVLRPSIEEFLNERLKVLSTQTGGAEENTSSPVDVSSRKGFLLEYLLDLEHPIPDLSENYFTKFEELRLKTHTDVEALEENIATFREQSIGIKKEFYETKQEFLDRERKQRDDTQKRRIQMEEDKRKLDKLMLQRAMEKEDRKELQTDRMELMKVARGGIFKKGLSKDQLHEILNSESMRVTETLKADITDISNSVDKGLERMELEVYTPLKESVDKLSNEARDRLKQESESNRSKFSELETIITGLKSEISEIKAKEERLEEIQKTMSSSVVDDYSVETQVKGPDAVAGPDAAPEVAEEVVAAEGAPEPDAVAGPDAAPEVAEAVVAAEPAPEPDAVAVAEPGAAPEVADGPDDDGKAAPDAVAEPGTAPEVADGPDDDGKAAADGKAAPDAVAEPGAAPEVADGPDGADGAADADAAPEAVVAAADAPEAVAGVAAEAAAVAEPAPEPAPEADAVAEYGGRPSDDFDRY